MTSTGLVLRSSVEMDPTSFRQDFPVWEPCFDDLFTSDGRRVDTHRTVRRSDTGAVLGVVGNNYVLRSHAQLAADLDALAAPFGGRLALGGAKVIDKGAKVTALVRLPEEYDHLLSVRGDRRGASLMLRDSRDGSGKETASVAVIRFACSNGLIRTGAKQLVAGSRHTRSIAWLPETLRTWARGVETGLQLTGRTMQRLDQMVFTPREAQVVVAEIMNPERKTDGQAAKREELVLDMLQGADGRYVPAYGDDRDTVRGIQILEAATAYDRHFASQGRSKNPADIAFRRIEKLADGEGFGPKAWDMLAAMVGAA